jgi:hypothetical protein
MSLEQHELQAIAELTVRLTELRQNECKHLCIENVAPTIFGRLVAEYQSAISYQITCEPADHGLAVERRA